MNREAAVDFYSRLMRSLQLNVYRFHLPELPQADLGILKKLGIRIEDCFSTMQFDIAENTIYMIQDMFLWRYILLRLPQDADLLLAGPYLSENVSDQTIMTVMERNGISPSLFTDMHRYYHNIRIISSDGYLLPILNTLGDILWGEEGYSTETLALNSESVFNPEERLGESEQGERQDLALIEKRYEIEKKLLYAIEHGQAHQAGTILSLIDPGQIDQRSPDLLRNMKNYAIISSTLMRKAAQQGGVHPFYIDQLSSTLGRRIESATNIEEVRRLMGSMVHKYCLLVKNHNMKGYSPPVQSVILHTDAELAGDLSLQAHAHRLGINTSYLSALFKKETGVTLTEYVNRRRIEYAVFLLNSTNMQIQTIAQHCGIPDVNYFTRSFKKQTGKTPSQYRLSIHSRL